jgi:hypothetical protein
MPARARLRLVLFACLTMVLGLGSRRYAAALPSFVARYAGDVLWASLVYWLLAWIRPRASRTMLAMAALFVAFAVEVSQLFHAPWIDGLRASRSGALVLGQGFLWTDLACYGVGVLIAAMLDPVARGRPSREP